MKVSNKVLTAFAAVACLGTAAQAQVTKSGSGYLIRMKFTKGSIMRYTSNTTVRFSGTPKPITVSGPMIVQVTNVQGDVGTLHTTVGPMKMSTGGSQPAQTTDIKENSRGKLMSGAGAAQMNVVLPEKPVAPGATWTSSTPLPGGMGTVNAKYKFVGVKSMGGKQVAQISVTMTGAGKTAVSGNGAVYLLASDGSMFATTTNMKMNAGGKDMSMILDIKRQQ